MRTTVKQLESAVTRYAELTGKNYILRHRDSRVGGYGVCQKIGNSGAISSDIICGKASEVYNELWAAIRAIEEYRQVQAEKPAPDGPQFIAVITDGILQSVISLTGKDIHYLLIDEDEIEIADENEGTSDEMSKNDILKAGVTEGLETGAFVRMSDCNITDTKPETVCRVLGYNLNYNAFNFPSSSDFSPAQ